MGSASQFELVPGRDSVRFLIRSRLFAEDEIAELAATRVLESLPHQCQPARLPRTAPATRDRITDVDVAIRSGTSRLADRWLPRYRGVDALPRVR
jgi:hypothetical protein